MMPSSTNRSLALGQLKYMSVLIRLQLPDSLDFRGGVGKLRSLLASYRALITTGMMLHYGIVNPYLFKSLASSIIFGHLLHYCC